jgi:hypothetical protein
MPGCTEPIADLEQGEHVYLGESYIVSYPNGSLIGLKEDLGIETRSERFERPPDLSAYILFWSA